MDKMDEQMITLLQKHTPNVKENMKLHIKQLKEEEEYYLLFAGKWQTAQKNFNLISTLIMIRDNCGEKKPGVSRIGFLGRVSLKPSSAEQTSLIWLDSRD